MRVRGGESRAPDEKPRREQEGERPPCLPWVSEAQGPEVAGPEVAAPAPSVEHPGDRVQPGSCLSLTNPSHRHLLLLADLVEELHVLDHGICWAIDRVVSAAKHCRSPWGVAAQKAL